MTRLTLRIDFPGGHALGHGKVRLLELIGQTGSISAAGRAMGMSYRRAWLLVDAINTTFATPAVETREGGSGGGGAHLTPLGRAIVDHYRAIEYDAAVAAQPRLRALEAVLSPPAQEPPMLKLSARNQIKGKITQVTKGQTTGHVHIEIAGGTTIHASITNEAIDDLGLQVGDEAYAVIKASDVMIGK